MADNDSDFLVEDGFGATLEGLIDPTQAAEDAFLDAAIEVLTYARANAPWLDRTGKARAGLDVSVTREGDQVWLELYHTVDYGLWLETIQSGEYAIIMPTLELFAQAVFEAAGGRVTSISDGMAQ